MAPPMHPKGEVNPRRKNSPEVVQEVNNLPQQPSSSTSDSNSVPASLFRDYKPDINGTLQGNSIMSKLKEEFAELCFRLSISEPLKKKAQDQWEELWLSEPKLFDEKRITWFTCSLYIALIDSRLPYGNPPQLTITDLLVSTNVHFQDFFACMQKSLRDIQNSSKSVKDHLQQLGKHYCVSNAMFYKFERIFEDVYKQSQNVSIDQDVKLVKKRCWVFFLLCKASYRNANTELFFCIQMLVCCIHYISLHTLSDKLNPPYNSDRNAIFNKHFRTPCELKPAQEAVEHVLKNVPKAKNGHLDVEKLVKIYLETYKREGNINELLFLDHNPIFSPLPSGDKEKSSTPHPENTNSPYRLAPLTPVSSAVIKVEQLIHLLNEQPDKPDDILKEFFQKCNPNPSDAICERIQSCKQSFVDRFLAFGGDQPVMQQLAQQRYQFIVKLYLRILKSFLISEQRRLGKNSFTSLLRSENLHRALLACSAEVILSTYGVSWNMAPQHMKTGSSEYDFPWVLEVFNLKAYDLFLVLESFLRSESKLSEDIRKHIQKVENEILERFAWNEDSAVFEIASDTLEEILEPPTSENGNDSTTPPANINNIVNFLPGTPGSGNNNNSNGANIPTPTTNNSINNNTSPSSSPPNLNPCPIESPAFSSVPDTPKSGRPLKHFFSKVFYLAHQRLSVLCQSLNVNYELKLKVWTCLRYCIISQRELLRHQHLDQIMMCCLFGICRVVCQDIKFKEIITVYKDLPHSQPEPSHVFKDILLQNGDKDSIVGFYNKVFLPIMKTYLLQFNPTRPSAPPLSPIPKYCITSSPVCRLILSAITDQIGAVPKDKSVRVSDHFTRHIQCAYHRAAIKQRLLNIHDRNLDNVAGKKNLHVSSVKSPIYKAQGQLTPKTMQLYCFGEGIGSAEKLRNINDVVSRSRASSCQKRLYFDNLDNAVGNVAKRLKFDGQDGSTSQPESTFKSPMSPVPRGSITPGKETPEKKESPSAVQRLLISPNTKRTQRHLRFDDNQGSSENETGVVSGISQSPAMDTLPNNRKENKMDK